MLSRNVGNKMPNYATLTSQKSESLNTVPQADRNTGVGTGKNVDRNTQDKAACWISNYI